jgi:hypothetical protein
MAKEVMERRASDNKYLHKDFHNLMNLGIEYIHTNYGEESVREYLSQFASSYYAPLKDAIGEKGLIAVKEHYEKIYLAEEALDSVSFKASVDELIIYIEKCPAVSHMKKSGITPSSLYHELTKTVYETVCEGTPYSFEQKSYDPDTGASVERFYRKK